MYESERLYESKMVTPRAKRLLKIAKMETVTLHQPCITSLHLLFGLLRIGGPQCREFLDKGLDAEQVAAAIRHLNVSESFVMFHGCRVATSAKKVLDSAAEEAAKLGNHWVGTEHILKGLLKEEEGPVAKLLADF